MTQINPAAAIFAKLIQTTEGRATLPHDHYQSVPEVAERLKVHEATVRHWIKDGQLRAIDIGKGWRIADSDLELFLHHHETRPRQTGDCKPAGGPLGKATPGDGAAR